jgi:hypothetical protein
LSRAGSASEKEKRTIVYGLACSDPELFAGEPWPQRGGSWALLHFSGADDYCCHRLVD